MSNWLNRIFKRRAKSISSSTDARPFIDQPVALQGVLVVCSRLCIGANRLPVKHAVREEAPNSEDSGWIVEFGTEDEAFANDPSNYALVSLERLISTDESLKILRDQPIGTELIRTEAGAPWRWVVDHQIIDEDGYRVDDH